MTGERAERARQAAKASIELVETNATGHRVLGEIGLYYDRDWERAGRYLERSIELSPSDASGHHSYATWLSARGRHDDALREVDVAAALDPGSVSISIDVMFLRYYARDFEGAVIAARRLERLWPGYYSPHLNVQLGRLAEANKALESAVASGRFSYFLPYLGVSPSFDRMCGHPGFERLLRRLQQATLSSETRLPRCEAAMGS